MATNDNQYRYLTNLSQGKNPDGSQASAGNIAWAKSQLTKYTPPKTNTTNTATANKTTTPTLGQGETYVRKFLTDSGIEDSRIGYDPTRKTVLLDGKDFITPTKNIGGYTAASTADLNKALSDFRNRDLTNKTYDVLSRIETAVNTPYQAPEFNYDPNTDPVYQAALRRAQANAATASGNAMAELNRRGILNSTITGDRVAQIQQSELGRVSDEVLPQLFEQAYNRYRDTVGDQQAAYRNRIADLTNLLGLNTGLVDRDRAYEQQGFQNRLAYGQATGTFSNGQRTLAGQQQDINNLWAIADATGVIPDQLADMYGIPRGTRTLDAIRQNAEIENIRADNARLASGGGGRIGGGGSPSNTSDNTIIDNANALYTAYDRNTGQRVITNRQALRNYIISLNLPDEQTDRLLTYYGLPIN